MEKDGNCLFRSFAHQIYGDAEQHDQVRQACYDYMEMEEAHFAPFVEDETRTLQEYIALQRKQQKWGDHPEIMAMSEL
jgi:hypothetical protein